MTTSFVQRRTSAARAPWGARPFAVKPSLRGGILLPFRSRRGRNVDRGALQQGSPRGEPLRARRDARFGVSQRAQERRVDVSPVARSGGEVVGVSLRRQHEPGEGLPGVPAGAERPGTRGGGGDWRGGGAGGESRCG